MASLDHLALFVDLTPEIRSFLSSVTQDRLLTRWEILFHEGEEANAFYIVTSWTLKAYHTSWEGADILGEIHIGEPVGEMALFTNNTRRNATVEAVEDTTLIVFPAFVIDTLRTKHPEILAALQREIEDRVVKNTLHTVQKL